MTIAHLLLSPLKHPHASSSSRASLSRSASCGIIGKVESSMPLYDPSPAALAPLLDTFWSSNGWRDPRAWPAPEVMASAVAAGVMFSGAPDRDHDGLVAAARDAVRPLTTEEVGDAFLASLTSHRLDLRSALGSYAVARHLPQHDLVPLDRSGICSTCGVYKDGSSREPNVLSFERFKWGGVARDKLDYITFDLEQFARAPRLRATPADIRVCQQAIDQLRDLPPETPASKAAPYLKMIPGNKTEREMLLDILGVCGILRTREYPGYTNSFIPFTERTRPPSRNVFRHYPICWWKASDGVDTPALRKLLPQIS